MKKRLKILLAILTVAVILSAVAVYSVAANSENLSTGSMKIKPDDASGYKYEIFTPSATGSSE